jgi:hypothetical protein
VGQEVLKGDVGSVSTVLKATRQVPAVKVHPRTMADDVDPNPFRTDNNLQHFRIYF